MIRLRAIVPLLLAFATWPSLSWSEDDLRREVLDRKYRRGDYAFYLSVHDPWDAQYDERDYQEFDAGTLAFPLGFKMRFRWRDHFRIEGDVSYYRRGEEVSPFLAFTAAPSFDGLMLSTSFQAVASSRRVFRPYVGAGLVFVSLSRDLILVLPGLEDLTTLDRFQLGHWNELDAGLQGSVGVDFLVGGRAFPFAEFRFLKGELGIDKVRVGGFEFTPEETHIPSTYDYSGPQFICGLKIRF